MSTTRRQLLTALLAGGLSPSCWRSACRPTASPPTRPELAPLRGLAGQDLAADRTVIEGRLHPVCAAHCSAMVRA